MRSASSYQARRLEAIANQIEENWDLAMALKKACFHDDSSIANLEFGFPLDVIGKPPTDEEIGE